MPTINQYVEVHDVDTDKLIRVCVIYPDPPPAGRTVDVQNFERDIDRIVQHTRRPGYTQPEGQCLVIRLRYI